MAQTSEMDEKYALMIDTPVERLICRMAVPTIITMLISSLYNMADTYFVGSLGTGATAAVGIVFSLMAIIQAVGFLFGQGCGNYISRELGAQNIDNAERMAATGFISAFVAGLLIMLGLFFLEPMAKFLGATETILPYACDYLKYILIGAPFMAASLMLNSLLRFQGSAFYGMIGMTIGAVLNVALDPLFIFVFDMGVSGAALATMLSQVVSFFLLLYGCTRKGNVHISLKKFTPSLHMYKEVLRGGFPSLCRQALASVAAICMNTVAGGYSDAVIAAISIVNRVTMFAISALTGFGQGFQPVCGFNYGAKRYDRVKKGYWFCFKISTVALTVIAVVSFLFAPWIITLFRNDPEVIEVGTFMLRLQCFTIPLMGWAIVSNMTLQTIGKAKQATIMALARQGLFMLPLLYILTPMLGLLGLELSQPIADFAMFLISIPLTIPVLREMSDAETGKGHMQNIQEDFWKPESEGI